MWRYFQTIIHEYIHTLTDDDYKDYANTLDNQRKHALMEGMTDVFTKVVWNDVSFDATLRQSVEGPFHDPANPTAIPDLHTYGATAQAEQVISIVGASNAYAAYFRGHTELIGEV